MKLMRVSNVELEFWQSRSQSPRAFRPAYLVLTKRNAASGNEIRILAILAISYPESSGFLVSGWAPEETLGNSKKFKFFDWLPCNDFYCFTAEILR